MVITVSAYNVARIWLKGFRINRNNKRERIIPLDIICIPRSMTKRETDTEQELRDT